jgi:hypothetical protein
VAGAESAHPPVQEEVRSQESVFALVDMAAMTHVRDGGGRRKGRGYRQSAGLFTPVQ